MFSFEYLRIQPRICTVFHHHATIKAKIKLFYGQTNDLTVFDEALNWVHEII